MEVIENGILTKYSKGSKVGAIFKALLNFTKHATTLTDLV
jgi:hypothetical protein